MIRLERLAERLMSMDEEVWLRHANPLSVWSRVAAAPVFFFSLWSVYLIGWYSLIPILLTGIWVWLNPRVFPKPRSTRNWASMGVLGERVYLNREQIRIPAHHARAARILIYLSFFLLVLFLIPFAQQYFWLAFFTFHGSALAKLWFVDRMVWLWMDMKDADPRYQSWDY